MKVSMKSKSVKKRKRGSKLPSGSFKGTGGRPSEITPEVQQKIVSAILINGYVETAAAFAGISKDTFYNWMRRGARSESGPYREFSDAVAKAMAEAEMRMSMVVAKAANGYDVLKTRSVMSSGPDGITETTTTEKTHEFDSRAAEWWLERARPQRWARREFVEMGSDPERPIKVEEVDPYDPLRMAKLIAAFADVQIIPPAVIELIEGKDFARTGNGQGPS